MASSLAAGVTDDEAATTSYVTVTYVAATDSTVTGVAVSILDNAITVRNTDAMIPGDAFVVTYYNVQVGTLGATDLNDPDSDDMLDYKIARLAITDDVVGADYFEEAAIKVSLPEQSTVTIDPPSVKSEAIEDIEVTYKAEATRYDGNAIRIDLPPEWNPAYGESSP